SMAGRCRSIPDVADADFVLVSRNLNDLSGLQGHEGIGSVVVELDSARQVAARHDPESWRGVVRAPRRGVSDFVVASAAGKQQGADSEQQGGGDRLLHWGSLLSGRPSSSKRASVSTLRFP